MPSDSSWKDKYLKELEDAEAREAHWDAQRNLLQRMLVRTSLASEGQSRELDHLLSRLRDELRKDSLNARAWQDLQERIDRKVSALDERKSETDKALRSAFEKLLSELRSHGAFDAVRDRLKDLEKRLRKPETLRNTFNDWLIDFASVLKAGLADSPGDRGTAQKGMFSRLFGRSDDTTPEPDAAPRSPDTQSIVELEAQGEEESDQRLRIARRVGELLGQMLEQVSLEPAAETRARRLRESLMASDDWDELREGLSGVAELVIAAVTRSQREFEGFLRRLDERLETLRQYFAEQENAQAGRMGASEELDQEIKQELEAFGRKVEDSQDFDGLKASVSGHLKSIREAVGRFRTKETEREKYLSEQLATMHEKMAAMETQAEQVRGELKEQRRRAMTDVLTELPNREAWQDRLEIEHQRWTRYNNPLTLAVLDIDFFKRVNDSFGHKAGDRVLQLVAKALRDRLRKTDFIARFGGEEFVLLFPETEAHSAKNVLDGLREHIKALPFHFRGEPVSVSFSAGIAEFKSDDQADEVFDRADRSLYQAKKSGRDQVCIAGQ
ncbi:diguanylate cyclase [Marinobacter sp. CHS3-4]|uniref:diguanylate cyclase n=1 Tax=Marinobacter sp. CHS3-4 TaxID=3045174 RepID=UPI0024B5760E|nr:diguanylate cyclase [Marinobacter sp. CHS3-4]MDI9246501.1 diguanylate cyclase [Marinobacter sp. CHS3-4]